MITTRTSTPCPRLCPCQRMTSLTPPFSQFSTKSLSGGSLSAARVAWERQLLPARWRFSSQRFASPSCSSPPIRRTTLAMPLTKSLAKRHSWSMASPTWAPWRLTQTVVYRIYLQLAGKVRMTHLRDWAWAAWCRTWLSAYVIPPPEWSLRPRF